MLVSTDFPFITAERLAPFPKWHTIILQSSYGFPMISAVLLETNTDVWGANRTGLYSILVKPINPKEEIQIVLKRYLEAVVLMFYRKRLKKTGRTAVDFCKK